MGEEAVESASRGSKREKAATIARWQEKGGKVRRQLPGGKGDGGEGHPACDGERVGKSDEVRGGKSDREGGSWRRTAEGREKQ